MLDYINRMFLKEGVDYFIDVVTGNNTTDTADLRQAAVKALTRRGEGLVLTVAVGANLDEDSETKLVGLDIFTTKSP